MVGDKIGNHSKPTLGVINAPPVQGGPRGARGGAGAATPADLPRHRLAQVGSWMGLGPCYVGACWYLLTCHLFYVVTYNMPTSPSITCNRLSSLIMVPRCLFVLHSITTRIILSSSLLFYVTRKNI